MALHWHKREATLLMLKGRGIHSQDLQERIFRKVFPTLKEIELYLEARGVSMRDMPTVWEEGEGFDCILAQEGGFTEDQFGVPPEDVQWLKKLAHALGLKYKGLGKYKHYTLFDITIPKKWYFKPDKPVEAIEICSKCRKKMRREEVAYTLRIDHYCSRCYDWLDRKGYLRESGSEDEY